MLSSHVDVKLVGVVQTEDLHLRLTWELVDGTRRIQTDILPPGHSGARFFRSKIGKKFTISKNSWNDMETF